MGAHIGGVECHFTDISCKDNDFFQCGLQILKGICVGRHMKGVEKPPL